MQEVRLPEELRSLARQVGFEEKRAALVEGLVDFISGGGFSAFWTRDIVRALEGEGWPKEDAEAMREEIRTALAQRKTKESDPWIERTLGEAFLSEKKGISDLHSLATEYFNRESLDARLSDGGRVLIADEPIEGATVFYYHGGEGVPEYWSCKFLVSLSSSRIDPTNLAELRAFTENVRKHRFLVQFGRLVRVQWNGKRLAHSLNQDARLSDVLLKYFEAMPWVRAAFSIHIRPSRDHVEIETPGAPPRWSRDEGRLGYVPKVLRYPLYRMLAEHVHRAARSLG